MVWCGVVGSEGEQQTRAYLHLGAKQRLAESTTNGGEKRGCAKKIKGLVLKANSGGGGGDKTALLDQRKTAHVT